MHALSELVSRDMLAAIARQVVREVLAAHVGTLIFAAVLWGLVGLLAGLALAALGFRLLGLTGLHALGGQGGRWLPRTRVVLTLLAGALAAAGFGAIEGPRRALPGVVKQSQIGTQLLPPLADGGATIMTLAPVVMRGWRASGNRDPKLLKLAVAQALGAIPGELDVPAFLDESNRVGAEFVALATSLAKLDILQKHPQLRGGVSEKLLTVMLPALVTTTVGGAVEDKARVLDLGDLRAELRAAAAAAGDPNTITHAELSGFLTDRVLVPPLLAPANHFLRSLQLVCGLVFAGALLLPSLLARLGAWLLARRAAARATVAA